MSDRRYSHPEPRVEHRNLGGDSGSTNSLGLV